jgi:hypothetical protein
MLKNGIYCGVPPHAIHSAAFAGVVVVVVVVP